MYQCSSSTCWVSLAELLWTSNLPVWERILELLNPVTWLIAFLVLVVRFVLLVLLPALVHLLYNLIAFFGLVVRFLLQQSPWTILAITACVCCIGLYIYLSRRARSSKRLQQLMVPLLDEEMGELVGSRHQSWGKDRTFVMYHGTSREAAEKIVSLGFSPSSGGMLGPGVYLSRSIHKAKRYPLGKGHNRVVLKCEVRVGRVIKIDVQGHPSQMTWHAQGYDSAWVPPGNRMVSSGDTETCIFDPNRISVIAAMVNT